VVVRVCMRGRKMKQIRIDRVCAERERERGRERGAKREREVLMVIEIDRDRENLIRGK